jgi:hypothetical protein
MRFKTSLLATSTVLVAVIGSFLLLELGLSFLPLNP